MESVFWKLDVLTCLHTKQYSKAIFSKPIKFQEIFTEPNDILIEWNEFDYFVYRSIMHH